MVYAHKTNSTEGCVAFASEKVNYLVIVNLSLHNCTLIRAVFNQKVTLAAFRYVYSRFFLFLNKFWYFPKTFIL